MSGSGLSTHSGASSYFRTSLLPQYVGAPHPTTGGIIAENSLFRQPKDLTHPSVRSRQSVITSFDTFMINQRKSIAEETDLSSEEGDEIDSDLDFHYNSRGSIVSCYQRMKRIKKISYEVFELEDKLSGEIKDFRVYDDSVLPFLSRRTEGSDLIRRNLI